MKFHKKLISMLLVMLMLIPMIYVQAANPAVHKISSLDYVLTNGEKDVNFNEYPSSSTVIFSSGAFLEYDFKLDEDENYYLSIEVTGGEGISAQVSVNGVNIGSKSITSPTKENVSFGIASFKSGVNKIRVTSTGALMFIYSITLEKARDEIVPEFTKTKGAYKNHFIPCKIEAEDFDLSGTTASDKAYIDQKYRKDSALVISEETSGKSLLMSDGEGAKYTFNVSQDGIYNLNILSQTDSKYQISYDEYDGYIISSCKSYEEMSAGNIYLTKGAHTVKVMSYGSDAQIDYLKFVCSSGDYISLDSLKASEVFVLDNEEEKTENNVWKEFYISPQGNDKNSGSENSPFLTIDGAKEAISKISDKMEGDIVVNILPGRYVIDSKIVFTEKDSGKNGFNIIYRGVDSKNKPIIDGGAEISGWEKLNDKIWYAKTGDLKEVRQLYVNGFMAQRARSKYAYVAEKPYDSYDTASPQDGFYISKVNFPRLSNTEDMECVFNINWTSQRVPVAKVVEEEKMYRVEYDMPEAGYALTRAAQNLAPIAGMKFYLENSPELIDEPGEFCFDRKKQLVYYYPFAEENMKEAKVYTGVSEGIIEAKGESVANRIKNITFDNIEFVHGAWNDVNRKGISFLQADAILPEKNNHAGEGTYYDTMHIQLRFDNADNINITNCVFANLGSNAVGFIENVQNSSIKANVFKDMSGGAISIGHWRYEYKTPQFNTQTYVTRKIDISNNVIRRVGYEYYGCVGIGVYYANSVNVLNNDIEELPYSGISVGWGWGAKMSKDLKSGNHKINNNRVVNVSCTVLDGGPIYTLSEMNGTVISGNYCKSNGNDYGAIYFDEGSKGITAYNNVLAGAQASFFGGPTISDVWNIYNNYTNIVDDSNYTQWNKIRRTASMKQVVQRPIRSHGENWGAKAREIINSAGVEGEYKHLLDNVKREDWRCDFLTTTPRGNLYVSDEVIEVEAKDYMPGGEGVGYHKLKAGTEPVKYPNETMTPIGDTNAGEWLVYEVDIPKDGEYEFKLYYALAFTGNEENFSSSTKTTVYVDGVAVCNAVPLEDTGSWSSYFGFDVGKINFTEGKHTVKVEFVDGGFAFWKFGIRPDNQNGNDKNYDDGIMFKPQ